MNQFYITLPSDSSAIFFPDNTVAHFTTKLAQRIHLNGEYEVALTEFIYPNNWQNFPHGLKIWLDDGSGYGELETPYLFRQGFFPKYQI